MGLLRSTLRDDVSWDRQLTPELHGSTYSWSSFNKRMQYSDCTFSYDFLATFSFL